MCMCIYIYIYMGLCLWIGGQGEDLIPNIFEASPECPEDLSLSILA